MGRDGGSPSTGRERLLAKIARVNGGLALAPPLPLVTIEDFLDGNDHRSSLAVHVHESDDDFRVFRDRLLALAATPAIDVLVEIYEITDGQWPYAERVYISAPAEMADDVLARCESLRPLDIGEGWFDTRPPGAPPPRADERILSLWWD